MIFGEIWKIANLENWKLGKWKLEEVEICKKGNWEKWKFGKMKFVNLEN